MKNYTLLIILCFVYGISSAQETKESLFSKMKTWEYEWSVGVGMDVLGAGESLKQQFKEDGFVEKTMRIFNTAGNPKSSSRPSYEIDLKAFVNEQNGFSISFAKIRSDRVFGFDSLEVNNGWLWPEFGLGNMIKIYDKSYATTLNYIYRTKNKMHYFEVGPSLMNQKITVKLTGRKSRITRIYKGGFHLSYQIYLQRVNTFFSALKLSYRWFPSSNFGPYTAEYDPKSDMLPGPIFSVFNQVKGPSHSFNIQVGFGRKWLSGKRKAKMKR